MTATGEDHVTARGGPWWWARRRSAVFDVSLAVVSALECALEGIPFARDAGIPVAAGVKPADNGSIYVGYGTS